MNDSKDVVDDEKPPPVESEDEEELEGDEEEELSLSRYIHSELRHLVNDPSKTARIKPFIRQVDAVCILGEQSQGQLPPLEWKVFRKAYTVLFWIRPVVGKPLKEIPIVEGQRLWYRFATTTDDKTGVGVCVQCGDWRLDASSKHLQTTLTAYAIPPKSSHAPVIQVPLTLARNEWSLLSFSHSFPYLKRPQWSVTVNGNMVAKGELNYPIVDVPMQYSAVLQKIAQGGVAVTSTNTTNNNNKSEDGDETMQDSSTQPQERQHALHFQLASCAVHADIVGSDLQALIYTAGPALSLQHLGKVVTPLPPIDNWTKGSSLEGPNVGIPLCVHNYSLDVQHLVSRAVYCFSANTNAKVLQNRILLTQAYVPGESENTPKVGLVQPGVSKRDHLDHEGNSSAVPTLQLVGDVHLKHALSEFLMSCESAKIDPNLFHSTQHLSIALLEQGLVSALVLPIFLAQLPPGHGFDLQNELMQRSLVHLYNLYTNNGEWASNLIRLLADTIFYGGGRAQETVLQGGIIHVLATTLRQTLMRAEELRVYEYPTLEKFLASLDNHVEEPWSRPVHDDACPSIVPSAVAAACGELVAACCGILIEIDFTPATKVFRSSDLALTCIFGLALNLDLWGKSETALLGILRQVSMRYGNVQGGQILRRQVPIQSLLDVIRSRLEFAQAEIAARFCEIVQHMLLASMSHRKNIVIGEHDIVSCMGTLSDCPLGSVGTHVVLASLSNILEWCNSSTDDEQLLQIAGRLGRNLIMSQYHDVVAPMLLSRTIFNGERSMTTDTSNNTNWETHWRMALTLFAWVTTISGPEGVVAAESAGGLLLASALAGSLKNCLIGENPDSAEYVAGLFLPSPSIALKVGLQDTGAWSYSHALADRLEIMMPLLPGFVVSLVSDDHIEEESLKVLGAMLSSLNDCFHLVFDDILHAAPGDLLLSDHAQAAKAAKDYVPHLILVSMWIEHLVREQQQDNEGPTAVFEVPNPAHDKASGEMEVSWVDLNKVPTSRPNSDSVLDTQFEKQQSLSGEADKLTKLKACQKTVLSVLTDLISNAMRLGGAEASTLVWRTVVRSLFDSMSYSGGRKSDHARALSQDMLCRLVAIVFMKVQQRDYEWQMWSEELSAAVARLCDMMEEKELLSKPVKDNRDQILLECALLDVLKYGREMTGWCQLILPTPPEPTQQESKPAAPTFLPETTDDEAQPTISDAMDESIDAAVNESTRVAIHRPYIPPEVPGASSKLLLPILQPCLRALLSMLESADSDEQVVKDGSTISLLELLISEVRETLVAAIVGLSFPNARDLALLGLSTIRRARSGENFSKNEKARALLESLFLDLTEEIRARYEGERRRREKALFDAYDDDEAEGSFVEADASRAVEQIILGDDLIPADQDSINKIASVEEINFEDPNPAPSSEPAGGGGGDDFVMFHETYASQGNGASLNATQMGWDQYKGLASSLEDCAAVVKTAENEGNPTEGKPTDAFSKTEVFLSLLSPYLDTWDGIIAKEREESEIVRLFDETKISDDGGADEDLSSRKGKIVIPKSENAADAMTTFIELASMEKSRLIAYVNTFLPGHRQSCRSYTERYCWSRYFELSGEDDSCGMTLLWERGIADGNRDIRSRLITMPCNPQFKRHIPRSLDQTLRHSADGDIDSSTGADSTRGGDEAFRSSGGLEIHKTLVEAGNLEIVDITKKEIEDQDVPEILDASAIGEGLSHDSDDDIYGDGSLGFPSRDEEDATSSVVETASTASSDDLSGEASVQSGITATKFSDKVQSGNSHIGAIASSLYSHPPDNSTSILSLLHASAPALIEKYFDNCLHVKAEGTRKCTMLLSATHLILEYDADGEGLFEGELTAVKEEAERERLIEANGVYDSEPDSEKEDLILQKLERRQKQMAALRPKSIRWNLSELSHVYLRRYRLRDTAIEMFFIPSGGSSYGGFGLYSPATSLFIDLGSGVTARRRRDEAAHAIMRRSPPQTIKQWPDRSGQFLHEQLSRLTMGWVEGRITNFDYLLHLNMLAGRSYNDLCQYPVMPWVLSEYKSEEIPDLTDPANFRDLSKPVGALNPDRLSDFRERFETFADPTIPPFMYGSHYSTSAGVVLHFLVRLHPFAGMHRQLQGGHFDVADRLFSSVPRTWDMCTGYSAAEVKELTPEWYCNPAFLKNSNNFKLGTSQDGELLGDVILPPWAKGRPETFVEVMRNALESDVCSAMLPDWIDLIFGRKQQGREAIKADNVFFYLTYYGSVDVAAIEDEVLRQATELQIAHFGQCPMQLFVRPHVRRVQKLVNFRNLTFYQMLSANTQGAITPADSERNLEYNMDGSQRLFGAPLHLPFFSSPPSHWIHLDAPPPGPHADLICVRLAGVDRCLAIDANGIFHSFRWAWKATDPDDEEETPGESESKKNQAMDRGNFVAQRELHRFKFVPRLIHVPSIRDQAKPAAAISKTLFASRSVLLVLSDGDGRGALAMQLVDPSKGIVKGEAIVPSVHAARISCISMDPIGTAAGHGGVGGELAIVGADDGGASLWRFMSSHYLPLRPRIRMRGHEGRRVQAVALSSSIHICATVSTKRCCIFSIGNGAMIRSFSPPEPEDTLPMLKGRVAQTIFAETPALCLSVQGFLVAVCKTTIFNDEHVATRVVITLHLFSLEGVSLGSKALESWRGVPHKIMSTPDGTAITVCSGRGMTIHRLSAVTPLEFIDEWQVTETDELDETVPAAWDVDYGPSLMRPIVAAAACSSGVLRLHALPGISPWSERHKKASIGFGKAFAKTGGRIRTAMGKGFGFGKAGATPASPGNNKDGAKEATATESKERGGFLSGSLFRKDKK